MGRGAFRGGQEERRETEVEGGGGMQRRRRREKWARMDDVIPGCCDVSRGDVAADGRRAGGSVESLTGRQRKHRQLKEKAEMRSRQLKGEKSTK